MPELTITGRITRRTVGRRTPKPDSPAAAPKAPRPAGPTRLARMLALAYKIEHLIDAGELKDYAHAARVLGVSRARVTQVMNLHFLPLSVQEAVLHGRGQSSERAARSPSTSYEQRNS